MSIKELRTRWAADPEFQRLYRQEYPFEAAAAAIAKLRAELGLTQAELAELIGSTQSVIARAESGAHSFQISLLQRIADATGSTWEPTFNLANVVARAQVAPYWVNWSGTVTGRAPIPFANPVGGSNAADIVRSASHIDLALAEVA